MKLHWNNIVTHNGNTFFYWLLTWGEVTTIQEIQRNVHMFWKILEMYISVPRLNSLISDLCLPAPQINGNKMSLSGSPGTHKPDRLVLTGESYPQDTFEGLL